MYRQASSEGAQQACAVCGELFASEMQIRDLHEVLAVQGYDFELKGGAWAQDLCPRCKRVERSRQLTSPTKETVKR